MHTGLHYRLSLRLHHTHTADSRRENGILTLVKGGMGISGLKLNGLL